MEIFFNELSIYPAVNSINLAREKITTLLETMKTLKEFDFNVLRTHDNFYGDDLGCDYTFSSYINDPEISTVHKLLLRTLVKNPFIADEETLEAEMFILNRFETLTHSGNITLPAGIAISYVHEVPTVSLSGFPLWNNDFLTLKVINDVNNNTSTEEVTNISNPDSIKTNQHFINWIESINTQPQLNTRDNIIKTFPEDQFEFDSRAISDIISWYYDDKRFLIRIKNLIEDIRQSPFVGGIGLTENLGGGKGSKRIVKKDRIVYTVLDKKIIIHSCKKHYNDK